MKARDLEFGVAVYRSTALRDFIRQHHYTKSCPTGAYVFGARFDRQILGAAVVRKPSLPRTGAAYGADLELSRFVLLDAAPRNSESRFLGYICRWLRKETTARRIVSFADPEQGHVGTIYKAANWVYLGREKGHGTRRIIVDGVEMHSKTAFDRWGCSGAKLAELLAPAKVEIRVCEPKHVYTYDLR